MRLLGITLRIDADRQRGHARSPSVGKEVAVAELSTVGNLPDASQVGAHVLIGLQADEIICGERLDEHLVMRQRDQHIGGWERRVQEEAEGIGYAELAQLGPEGDEVIVVHPNHVVRPNEGHEHLRQVRIDAEVSFEGAALVFDQPEPIVE